AGSEFCPAEKHSTGSCQTAAVEWEMATALLRCTGDHWIGQLTFGPGCGPGLPADRCLVEDFREPVAHRAEARACERQSSGCRHFCCSSVAICECSWRGEHLWEPH
ncbi:unnamed protein product, partial [Symbiodinium necroappetens]